jgi:hypothetical protein
MLLVFLCWDLYIWGQVFGWRLQFPVFFQFGVLQCLGKTGYWLVCDVFSCH